MTRRQAHREMEYRRLPGGTSFGLRFWLYLFALGIVAWSPFAAIVLWVLA